jgi:predicted extracellular nuclease
MLVAIDNAVVVGPAFSGCGLAVAPDELNAARYFRHQLSETAAEVINILHTSNVFCGDFPAVQVGDRMNGISGPLHFHFDQYKIVNQQTAALQIQPAALPELPTPLTAGEGELTIATINLHDYFDTLDDTGDEAEPKPTEGELAVKQAKIIYGIGRSLNCPTIIGVQEVENAALLRELAAGLVEFCGFTYQVSHLESADSRGIDVALLSDPRQVNILNIALRQSCTPVNTDVIDLSIDDCPAGQSPLFSRPPLQVDAAVGSAANGRRVLTIYVNHFKSKREGELETASWRLAQGAYLRRLVEEQMANDREAEIVVMGDFNDFARSPVMEVMTAENLLINVLLDGPSPLPPAEQYTYIFGGLAQMIDGILLSPTLADLVVGTMILHANADFPYTLDVDTSTAGMPYRFSDHDVPLVLLKLNEEPPPAIEPPAEEPAPTTAAVLAPATAVPAPPSLPDGNDTKPAVSALPILGILGGAAVFYLAFLLIRRKSRG